MTLYQPKSQEIKSQFGPLMSFHIIINLSDEHAWKLLLDHNW